MMAALGVLQVREQFYRLDARAAGLLSSESYNKMLTSKESGAKGKWRGAAGTVMQEIRVLKKLQAFCPGMASSSSAASRAPASAELV